MGVFFPDLGVLPVILSWKGQGDGMKLVSVIPRVLDSEKGKPGVIRTNGFTISAFYNIIGHEGSCAIVRNDNGHKRVVFMDGSPCSHIVRVFMGASNREKQVMAGFFQVIYG
jgi:hypothetical protein